jgi:hypothetical protein
MDFRDDMVTVVKENIPVRAGTKAAAIQFLASNFIDSTTEHRMR